MQNKSDFLNQIQYSRGLSQRAAVTRGLGVIAAVIIFVLLGETAVAVGPYAPLAILLTTLLVVANCLGYAELAVSVARPGGAYTLVREGQGGGGLAFLTGWALTLSGIGLCGLLAQGAASHLALLLESAFRLTLPVGLLGMGLTLLILLDSGLGKRRRLPFTLLMAILLLALALVSRSMFSFADYAATYSQPRSAVPLLMAAFVGIEIIAGHLEEIRRRATQIPRVLIGAPVLAAALGAVLAAVAWPQARAAIQTPLASLGEATAGMAGQTAILGLGLIVPLLSMKWALTTVVRQLYGMSRDGFCPASLCQFHPRQGAPVRLILLVGFLILPVVWIPIGFLSQVSGLLYLFVLMAVNLILARRPQQATLSSFALPFHPWAPALTLAVDLLVVSLWGSTPIAWALGCLAVGGLVYLVYGRSRHIEAQEGITVFRPPTDKRAPEDFRVLVPIANPATAGRLLRIAGRLAQSQGGDVLALQVVVIPESVPLEAGRRRAQAGRALLEKALRLANEENLPVQTITRVAHSIVQGILDTAADEGGDVILMGWQNATRSRTTSPGPVVDGVLRNASCDVLIVRGGDTTLPKKILVPTAGGPHARVAAQIATSLAEAFGATVTLLGVQSGPATPQQMEENRRRVAETLEGFDLERLPEQKVVLASGVVEGIVKEAQEYDLVLLGVSEETLLDRFVFGSVPLQAAARVPAAILVQGYRGITELWIRRVTRALLNVLPVLSSEEQLEVRQELSRGARPGINYFVLIVLSCVIAALGLLSDSAAVVIGAMLVAPLMSPIMAFSLGLVQGDLRLIRFSIESIIKGVALAVIIAAFMGLLSPFKTATGEMLARGQPTLLDMAVALVSGMAGAYALARKDVSAALPGVSIAAALMPPLATVGLGLSMGNAWVAGGAFLLFLANIAAISLAAGVGFPLLGIRPQTWGPESRRRLWQRLFASLFLLLVIAVPLGAIMSRTVRNAAQEQTVREILTRYVTAENGQLVNLEIEEKKGSLLVVATMRSTQPFDQEMVDGLAEALNEQSRYPVRLEVIALPVIRSHEKQ